jgi:cell division GTPase FtsZ
MTDNNSTGDTDKAVETGQKNDNEEIGDATQLDEGELDRVRDDESEEPGNERDNDVEAQIADGAEIDPGSNAQESGGADTENTTGPPVDEDFPPEELSVTLSTGDSSTTDREQTSEPRKSPESEGENSASTSRSLERRKWLLVGVGGCGNNLIDSVHLRKDNLYNEGNPAVEIWNSGIQDTISTNTNRTELRESYYAEEVFSGPADEFAILHEFPGEGAGEMEQKGAEFAEQGFEERDMYARWAIEDGNKIQRAQAVMFLHSAVQGTGSGSTPVVAERFRDDFGDEDDLYLYSGVVLPDRREDYLLTEDGHLQNPRILQNATVCLSQLSEYIDVIIPFNNKWLDRNQVETKLNDAENYFDMYVSENRSFVSYLEAFSLSSIPTTNEVGIKGSGKFDIYDTMGPVDQLNPQGYSSDEEPATLFAPAHAKTVRGDFGTRDLRKLLEILVANPLAEFDPTTAWGAALLFYGPEEKIDSVQAVGRSHLLKQALDVFEVEPGFSFELSSQYIVVPTMDDVHLWAGFWNPEMQIIDDCVRHAETQIDEGGERGERIQGFETKLQNLKNNLGRDAFK